MDKRLLSNLADGAKLIFENAKQLYQEARLLRDVRAYSRSLFLHQISMEECAKIETIGVTVFSDLLGEKVEFKKVEDFFRSHARKNRTNAYFLEPSLRERKARKLGDLKAALEAFEKTQHEFHLRSNSDKNAALYVDVVNGVFQAPASRITARMTLRLCRLNEKYLQMAEPKIALLERLQHQTKHYQKSARWFKDRLHAMAAAPPSDVEKALLDLASEMRKELKQDRAIP